MKKAILVLLLASSILALMAGTSMASDTSTSQMDFNVVQTLDVQTNNIHLGAVSAGLTEVDNQTLGTVSGNVVSNLIMSADPNFTRADGATIPIGNLGMRPNGFPVAFEPATSAPSTVRFSNDPYWAAHGWIPGAPVDYPIGSTQLVEDIQLNVPWDISPSASPFSASATLTIVPAP